jgi:phosphatidylserine decarboxylase
MVRDGFYYGGGLLAVAGLVAWLLSPWYSIAPLLLAAFFLWFFRDPERVVPLDAGLIVSPADGKVTDVSTVLLDGSECRRISIFLSVFDVHVNRSPISGVVKQVEYRRGKFTNAMSAISAEQNEQNIVTVEGENHRVIFKQIAGLLARRIVFTPHLNDLVTRGQRVGLIKFGSRVDVIVEPGTAIAVKVGDRVKGGSSVLGRLQNATAPHAEMSQQGARALTGDR